MVAKIVIGVMGPGENATPEQNEIAYDLGKAIAENDWILLTGGRNFGVMEAAMKGARELDGLTIGILPDENDKSASKNALIKIPTGMGSARNVITVLSSKITVVVGMAAGTASEVAHALKANRKIILLNQDEITVKFFKQIGGYKVMTATSVEETLDLIKDFLSVHKNNVQIETEEDS